MCQMVIAQIRLQESRQPKNKARGKSIDDVRRKIDAKRNPTALPSLTLDLQTESMCKKVKSTRNRIFTRYFIALITFLFIAWVGATGRSNDQPGALSPDDERAIKATIEAYRTAWLKNDAKGVLKTFTDDAVLLPAHGSPAVTGIAAIKKYWFTPGGPTTTVT